MNRFSDCICAVCAKPAVGFGYAPHPSKPVAWVCSEECLQPAKDSYNMSVREFDRISNLAAKEGGAAGGAFLESLGRFALDELSEEEYDEYCRHVVDGYRTAMETTLRNEAPF